MEENIIDNVSIPSKGVESASYIHPSYLDENNQTVTLEFEKIKHLIKFRESLIKYLAPYATKLILQYNPHFNKPPHIFQFFNEIFVKWFFNNNLSGNIKAFVPLSFEVLDRDLQYIIARNGCKKVESIQLNYDKTVITKELHTLHLNLKEVPVKPVFVKYTEKNEFNKATNNIVKTVNFEFCPTDIPQTPQGHQLFVKTITISGNQFERLKELYIASRSSEKPLTSQTVVFQKDFLDKVGMLLLRYDFLGSLNEHLSVPPRMLKSLKVDTELFGTPFNTTCTSYCSPFLDIEKYFGSNGSFFDFELQSDKLYFFNPPFDEELMKLASEKILQALKVIPNITIIVTLPVWDSKSQQKINIRDNGMTFEAFEILKASVYCKESSILNKNIHLYFNFFENKNVSVSYSHLIVLSNGNPAHKINKIQDSWQEALFLKNK